MNWNHSELLEQDIRECQRVLKGIFQEIRQDSHSDETIMQGLQAAHTLKALAAVRGIPHLEQYAAQLEQLFLSAQALPSSAVTAEILPRLHTLSDEFKAVSRLESEQDAARVESKAFAQVEALMNRVRFLEADMAPPVQAAEKSSPIQEVPIETIFQGFVPWIRQAAQAAYKDVAIDIQVSEAVLIPRHAITPVQTILVHLLRNAIHHGIERPTVRKKLGKTPTGTIQLAADITPNGIVITVSDDGTGTAHQPDEIDCVLAAFSEIFETDEGEAEDTMMETSIYSLKGAQTGLGIGLHIVQSQAERLQGHFELKSIPGLGSSAITTLPKPGFDIG